MPLSVSTISSSMSQSFLSESDGGSARARILALLERLSAEGPRGANAGYLRRILVRTNGRVIFVHATDVDWVEAAGNYGKLHVGSAVLLVRTTLAAIGERLDPAGFARIHRSTIVNMDRVREMQPWFSGDSILILQDGAKLRVSRTYRERLERQLDPAPAASRESPS